MKSGATRERGDYERDEASRKLSKRDADLERELFWFRVIVIGLLLALFFLGVALFHRHVHGGVR